MSGATSDTSDARRSSLPKEEWFLGVGAAGSLVLLLFGGAIMELASNISGLVLVFAVMFGVALVSIFSVVRHAEHLALRLGEPYGTLILTLAVTSIEVVSVSALMLHEGSPPTLARDTLFAVVMIILNGMVGLSLLVGGWRHREQTYNLQGANAYLHLLIPLAVLTLLLPNYTLTTTGPTLATAQGAFLGFMALGLYGAFLAVQTSRHRAFFTNEAEGPAHGDPGGTPRSILAHIILLMAYMAVVVHLAEQLAHPVHRLIEVVHAPAALGGFVIAMLVATPEALGAVRAARDNQLQRSVNIFLGSVLATIGLTVPAMLVVSHLAGKKLVLGLQNTDVILLPTTLFVSVVTFASGRTNILQGAVHLLLFSAYILLLFQN